MSTSARPTEIKALAGARALPPLILVLFHFCEGHGYRGAGWFDLPVGKGYLWVEFFFALSGFILIHVYGSRAREFWRGKAYGPFLRARLSRLYPLQVFTLFSMLFLMLTLNALADWGGYVSIYHQPYHPMNTAWSFVANLFLVQGWNLFPWLTWNGASWFVSVEFMLCLLFPIYILLSRGGLLRAVALIGAGLAALTFMAQTSGHGLDITFHDGVFRGMAGFAVGVGMAMLFRQANEAGAERLPEWIHSVAQAAALGILVLGDLSHRLGTPAARHMDGAGAGRSAVRARIRPRLPGARAFHGRAAQARRMVVRDLYGTDLLAAGRPLFRAARLSAVGRDRIRRTLRGFDLVDRAGCVASGVHRLGGVAGDLRRASGQRGVKKNVCAAEAGTRLT